MADVLRHPWCAEGLAPETMLRCNDAFVVRSLAAAPSPCTLAEVRALLAEAACGPQLPGAGLCLAEGLAGPVGPSSAAAGSRASSASSGEAATNMWLGQSEASSGPAAPGTPCS